MSWRVGHCGRRRSWCSVLPPHWPVLRTRERRTAGCVRYPTVERSGGTPPSAWWTGRLPCEGGRRCTGRGICCRSSPSSDCRPRGVRSRRSRPLWLERRTRLCAGSPPSRTTCSPGSARAIRRRRRNRHARNGSGPNRPPRQSPRRPTMSLTVSRCAQPSTCPGEWCCCCPACRAGPMARTFARSAPRPSHCLTC